jgi:hypothetical protein
LRPIWHRDRNDRIAAQNRNLREDFQPRISRMGKHIFQRFFLIRVIREIRG